MKTSILLYSRDCHQTSEILAVNLSHAGYQIEQSHLINISRIALNPYSIIHFLIRKLPLTTNELLCLKVAQTLGKIVVLSIIDSNVDASTLQLNLFTPEGFTVSQTNHLQYYRKWPSFRMVLPSLPALNTEKNNPAVFPDQLPNPQQELYLFLFSNSFEEAQHFSSQFKTYFDGSALLKNHSAFELRKKWQELVKIGKISDNNYLILSKEKSYEIFNTKNIAVVLNYPEFLNHEITSWIELAVKNHRFVILNEHQAAGFNNYWTSGQNCFVLSEKNWVVELIAICEDHFSKNQLSPWTYVQASPGKLYDPLTNELSRLYTKILHQKTRLLRTDSANI